VVQSRGKTIDRRAPLHARSLGALELKRSSRRGLFAAHASDPRKVKHCPICQTAIEQDHAEALGLGTEQIDSLSHLREGLSREASVIADGALDLDLVQGVRRLAQ
jgi:hypothetical protein